MHQLLGAYRVDFPGVDVAVFPYKMFASVTTGN